MLSILIKELRGFYNSLQGYIVSGLFLLITALFLWVIPGTWNIPANGYANINGLFVLAPWLFLFFIPALTMRLFSEEYRTGTIELLVTRPVSKTSLVLGKYFASLLLLIITLLPALIWVISLSKMAQPQGNVDMGAIWGSFIALFFLGAAYAAIGLLGSALTDNQVVAFLVAVSISFFVYSGIGLLGSVPLINAFTGFMQNLGIEQHYNSMSRGVLDSRDLLYFISVIVMFLATTVKTLKKRLK